MTAKAVSDEQLGKLSRKWRELQSRVESGVVPFRSVDSALQDLLGLESARPRLQGEELFKAYRQVRGLIFIGPAEWERALRSRERRNPNPLELETGWCRKLKLPAPRPIEVAKSVAAYCRGHEWSTTPILWLIAPKIVSPKLGEISMTLVNQNKLWGVEHDGVTGGLVRQDVFWSNWFVKPNYDWAGVPATEDWEWSFGYEFPAWTARMNWENQQKAVSKRPGVKIATACRDALMLNIVLAATGKRLCSAAWVRTATLCGGCPLTVSSYSYGVDVSRYWYPGDAYDHVGVALEGVLDFDT